MATLSREALSKLLDERIERPEHAADFDRRIWEQCGADRGILVLDLSGFTRLTRKHGILHFLAVYRRAARLVGPLVLSHGGRLVKGEADNVIASFPAATNALECACAMIAAAAGANQTLAEDDQIRLCIAVGFGKILELTDDFFGDQVNITFKLGEDVARAGEVLISDEGLTRLKEEGAAPDVDERHIEVGGVAIRYFCLRA